MNNLYFHNEGLIEKYGSWIGVQVAFYDFLFTHPFDLCKFLSFQDAWDCFVNRELKGMKIYDFIIKFGSDTIVLRISGKDFQQAHPHKIVFDGVTIELIESCVPGFYVTEWNSIKNEELKG